MRTRPGIRRRGAGAAIACAILLPVLALGAPASAEESGHGAPAPSHEAPLPDHGAAAAPDANEPGDAPDARWATTRAPMPFDVMRSVQFLQDQVARGNDRAIRVQALLLRRFGRSFLEADPAVWQDPRNFRALVLFTLSGGSPEVIDRLAKEKVLDASQTALVEGSSAYVHNELTKASKHFAEVDVGRMEPVLAAQLSLAMGQIRQIEDPAGAVPHLDRARLLAPGTLIEEAALRLEATIVDGLGDTARADHLARQYFDRFADSSYAANFETRFGAIYVARAATDPDAAMLAMESVVGALPEPRRARLFLSVTRRSLVEGSLAFANAAALNALAGETLGEPDRIRGSLYEIASRLGSTEPDAAREALDAIDRVALHPEDALLLDAAYGVVDSIDGDVPVVIADTAAAEPGEAAVPSVLARAEQVLSDATQDLRSSQP